MQRLGIFETFKTKNDLTGEALRQRAIIACLVTKNNPGLTTRTAIAQKIANDNGTLWKNIYSGIFRDIDEILVPHGIVKEAGRLPLKRGPKALQEKGIPYYKLTDKGLLVALAIDEVISKEKILEQFFSSQKNLDGEFAQQLVILAKFAPRFVYSMFKNYVKAYCDGVINEILPFDKSRFLQVSDEHILMQKEFLENFINIPKSEKEKILRFLEGIR